MKPHHSILPIACFLALLSGANGAVVATYSGSQLNMTAWRTTTVDKPLDVDGDDVIGTVGYHLFGAAGERTTGINGANGSLASLPSYITVTRNVTSEVQYNYALIDNPVDNSPATIKSGTADGGTGSKKIATITFGSGVSPTLSLVLMNDNLDNTGFNATTGYQIRASNGTTVLATAPLLTGNKVPDWYFFSLSGLAAGDSVQVWNQAGRSTLGGIAFDVVPEPGSSGLLALAGVAGLMVRRRRK